MMHERSPAAHHSRPLLRGSLLALVAAAATVLPCCAPGPEVVAEWSGGAITVGDLDEYMVGMPPAVRARAPEQTHEQWVELNLRRLAVERILEAEALAGQPQSSPELQARRLWQRANALVAALDRQLADEVHVRSEEVEEAMTSWTRSEPAEPLLSLRNIFVRLDRPDPETARQRASKALAAVAAGEDFAEVARRFSDSASAASGGLVNNARPSDLEAEAAEILAELAEGETSALVETRTGLHIFKLERRLTVDPAGDDRLRERAALQIRTKRARAKREELMERLRQSTEVDVDGWPWRVGGWTVDAEVGVSLLDLAARTADPDPQQRAVDHLLLADEARRRGLETEDLEARLEASRRAELIQRAYIKHWQALLEAIPHSELSSIYDAQPTRFATPKTASVQLIFVPQGRDAFATQTRLDHEVQRLRSGAVDFADLARAISEGPEAEHGGELGSLAPQEWARLNPALHPVISALDLGEVSDPVYLTDRILAADPRTLRGGFAVVRVTDHTFGVRRSFEDAVDEVRAHYVQQHRQELENELAAEILEQAVFATRRIPTPDELSR